MTLFSEDNTKATASRLNSAVYRLLMLLLPLTTCDCFLRDHPSQYQAVRPAGGTSDRARVEHTFARMKSWKILRDCRLKGDGVHHAMLGIARLHNLALAG